MAAAAAILRSYIFPVYKSSIGSKNPRTPPFNILKFRAMTINATNAMEQPLKARDMVHGKSENCPSLPVFPFNEYMTLKVEQVNNALDEMASLQHLTEIQDAMRYSLLSPGKRLSAILCLASCELVGGDELVAMPISCAIEMIQAMSLMFDDLPCIDNDEVGRRLPSNHMVFGEETTILAGTSLVCLAFQHIVESTKNASPERLLRSIVELASSAGFNGLQGGQLLDVRSEGKQVSLAELDLINAMKSVKLIEASVVCGAIIGGGNDIEIERLRKYARHMGLCGQVVDDIRDLTKDTKRHRKIRKKEWVSYKLTYPNLIGIDGAKKYVDERVAEAIEELAHFETARAAPLYHLTNHIANLLN